MLEVSAVQDQGSWLVAARFKCFSPDAVFLFMRQDKQAKLLPTDNCNMVTCHPCYGQAADNCGCVATPFCTRQIQQGGLVLNIRPATAMCGAVTLLQNAVQLRVSGQRVLQIQPEQHDSSSASEALVITRGRAS